MSTELGDYLRNRRIEKQQKEGNAFSLCQLATRIGVEPSYLSKTLLFIACLGALIASLIVFLRDINLSLQALELEISAATK